MKDMAGRLAVSPSESPDNWARTMDIIHGEYHVVTRCNTDFKILESSLRNKRKLLRCCRATSGKFNWLLPLLSFTSSKAHMPISKL